MYLKNSIFLQGPPPTLPLMEQHGFQGQPGNQSYPSQHLEGPPPPAALQVSPFLPPPENISVPPEAEPMPSIE